MLKRFESFVPRKVDDRQEKGRVFFEERFKKLIDLAKQIKEKFNKKFKIVDDEERFLVNIFKNSEIKINYSESHTLYFFNKEGEYLAEIDFEEGVRLWLSGDNIVSRLQKKHGLHYFKELDKFVKETFKKYFDIVPTKIDHTVSSRDEYLELDYQDDLYKDPYILGIDESFVPRKIDERTEDRAKQLKKKAHEFKQKIDKLKTLKGEDRVEKDFINYFKAMQVRYWPRDQFMETVFFFYDDKFDACYDYSKKQLTCSRSLMKTFKKERLEDLFVSLLEVDSVSAHPIYTSPEIFIDNNKERMMIVEVFVPRTEERDRRRKEMNERIKKEKHEFAKQLQETLSNINLETIKDEKEVHFLSMFVDAKVRINLNIYDTIFIFRGRKCIAEVDYDTKSVSLDFPEIWKKFEDMWKVKYDESIRLISKYLGAIGLKNYHPVGAPEGSLFLASRELSSLSNI